jgi:excisionase family DNA binding protein
MTVRLELDDQDLERLAELVAPRVAAIVADRACGSPWLDALGAAEYLRCSISRVRKLTMLDELPAHRDGGRVLYRRDALDSYIENGGASTGRYAHRGSAPRDAGDVRGADTPTD